MQLPSIDRSISVRPSGADLVSSAAARVIPVAPVNPAGTGSQASSVSEVGAVNLVNQAAANKPHSAESVYTSVSDPAQRGSEAATAEKDWTIRRPAPEKVEEPPKEPIGKLLLDFLHSVWRASGSAIELAQMQQQNQNQNPDATPGELAKAELTYSLNKIKKVQIL